MRFLALDIGTRHTGVAYMDEDVGIPLPLDTIHHTKNTELLERVLAIVTERKVNRVIVGLPLLLSGAGGSQSTYVRGVAGELQKKGLEVVLLDERYTTHSSAVQNSREGSRGHDPDAAAACALLASYTPKDSI